MVESQEVKDMRKITAPINGRLGGRPVGTIEDSTRYRRLFLNKLAEMIEKHKVPLIQAMIDKALEGNVEAFKALLDRAQGKPAQAVEIGGQNGSPIVFMPLELIQRHSIEVLSNKENMAKNIETGQDMNIIDVNVEKDGSV